MAATFPEGFLFGAAVGAHQVEGGNTNSDWWWWEHREGTPCVEPSGDACDFYHRYDDDIAMLAGFGLNAFRFGIEWARIEPAEGEFSTAQLGHYRRMLEACHAHGVTPILTFHHFTLPRWVHDLGGFADSRFPRLFERYCERAARSLGDQIGYACTLNEPQGLGWSGYMLGVNPPGVKGDERAARRAADNLIEAHRLATPAIKAHTKAPVGVARHPRPSVRGRRQTGALWLRGRVRDQRPVLRARAERRLHRRADVYADPHRTRRPAQLRRGMERGEPRAGRDRRHNADGL